MAKTLTTQTRLPPSSGNDGTRDGDPMSTRLPHDLVRGLNNLTYVNPYWGHAQWPPSRSSTPALPYYTLVETSTGSDFGRSFLAQMPVILPRDAHRFCWTLGFYHDSSSYAHDVTITEVTTYISPTPYRAPRGDELSSTLESLFFFDTFALPSQYGVSEYDTEIACPGSTLGYHLVDMSAGTEDIDNWMPFTNPTREGSGINHAWLIVSFNRETDDVADLTGERVALADFDWWVQYE